MDAPVILEYPFRGRWRVENSPARRVPSHGTPLFGLAYAIDFVAVDASGRSAPWSARGLFGTEPPERFVGFGVPVLAPVAGRVVAVHDGEPDHEARRSPLRLAGYALTQASRARRGIVGLAGNHVALDLGPGGGVLLLAHLRRGSVRVAVGDPVAVGDVVGECGNSGNSTEPHVHLQLSSALTRDATGLPIAFRGGDGTVGVPGEGEIVVA